MALRDVCVTCQDLRSILTLDPSGESVPTSETMLRDLTKHRAHGLSAIRTSRHAQRQDSGHIASPRALVPPWMVVFLGIMFRSPAPCPIRSSDLTSGTGHGLGHFPSSTYLVWNTAWPGHRRTPYYILHRSSSMMFRCFSCCSSPLSPFRSLLYSH